MKSLTYFLESKDEYGRDILINNEITFEEIEKAIYNGSFMKDRATIYVGKDEKEAFGSYDKIAKNKWHYNPVQSHALGGNYTDKEMYEIVQKYEYAKMYLQ